ncbi:MAG: DUF4367 domain-containing protein [Oscillospiraceae bacterium]|nr:DUF4367 domain-containing protein [Oscillospiraceae bacterium]
MSSENTDVQNKIFDSVLAEALREDCEREVGSFKDGGEEHAFGEKFEKSIKAVQKQLRRKQNAAKLKKVAPKLAASAAAVALCVSLAANPAVGSFLKGVAVKISGGDEDDEGGGGLIDGALITVGDFDGELRPSYLPEGYRITRVDYGFISVVIEYSDNDGKIIEIKYVSAAGAEALTDGGSPSRSASVGGKEADFYEAAGDGEPGRLIWSDGGYAFVISAQIEPEEFIKIAESIKIP